MFTSSGCVKRLNPTPPTPYIFAPCAALATTSTSVPPRPFWPFDLVGQAANLRRLGKPPRRRVNYPPQVGNLPYVQLKPVPPRRHSHDCNIAGSDKADSKNG